MTAITNPALIPSPTSARPARCVGGFASVAVVSLGMCGRPRASSRCRCSSGFMRLLLDITPVMHVISRGAISRPTISQWGCDITPGVIQRTPPETQFVIPLQHDRLGTHHSPSHRSCVCVC
eukprot:scaffold1695_cov87-Phaeocystis_antarctica.AAC.2